MTVIIPLNSIDFPLDNRKVHIELIDYNGGFRVHFSDGRSHIDGYHLIELFQWDQNYNGIRFIANVGQKLNLDLDILNRLCVRGVDDLDDFAY